MALVTWSDKLSVGVKSIDTQHTVLFNSINELHAAMLKGQARTVVGGLLCDLLVYTRSHFSAEEALMASTGYPGLPVHHAKHIHLTKQVEEYVARFEISPSAIIWPAFFPTGSSPTFNKPTGSMARG
jgi:hemerythrin-like metal-binding protein